MPPLKNVKTVHDPTTGSGKVLYQCREVRLIQNDDGAYRVRIGEAEDAQWYFENPLEAWNCYITMLDCRVRHRIGDMLEHEGKNRYTGAPQGVKS